MLSVGENQYAIYQKYTIYKTIGFAMFCYVLLCVLAFVIRFLSRPTLPPTLDVPLLVRHHLQQMLAKEMHLQGPCNRLLAL